MPEGLEAEIWRVAAAPLTGRTITEVWVDERVAPPAAPDILEGAQISAIERRGKVVVLHTVGPSGEVQLGLHFGMTGRIVVDGEAAIERLEYASGADRPDWDRLRLWTGQNDLGDGRPALRMNDPRRLGHVSIDPDLAHLGPDALTLTAPELREALSGRRMVIKSALLDQEVVAGIGNLCADEVLFAAGVAPQRRCDELTTSEIDALARAATSRLPEMLRLGGSTTGWLDPSVRSEPGDCPRDGSPLERTKIGGRTAVWCPSHQH